MKEKKEMSKLGTAPVNRLMLSMGVPMILSMMLQAVYNIVDSAFVSNMKGNGEAALNALTLAFPVQMLMVAIGIGTGVGTNALLAKSLGQDNREKASYVAGNAMFLGAVIYAVFLLFGIVGVNAYVSSQTNNKEIAGMAVDYLRICCIISVGVVYFAMFEKLLQATGRSQFSTIAQVAGAVINMVLDPILIYGYLGLPAMGVQGAAYATVIGQIVSMLLGLIFHLKFNKEVDNGLKFIKPIGKIIKEIYSIGLAAIIAQALMSVMTYGLNIIFGKIDTNVVTAYGLYYKIQQFILFAAFGLRDAITPIISFNHGMGSRKRINDGIKYGMTYTLVIMLAGLVLLEVFAGPLAKVFGLSGQTERLCVDAIHIVSISFLCAGANIAFQGIFQALDGGVQSFVLSVCRQFLFIFPVAWGFAQLAIRDAGKTWTIWLTFIIAEILTALIACIMMRGIRKKRIDVLA